MPQHEKNGNGCEMHAEVLGQIRKDQEDIRNHLKPLFAEYDESRTFRAKAMPLVKLIPDLVIFKERAKIAGILLSFVFAVSFLYTRWHIVESNHKHEMLMQGLADEKELRIAGLKIETSNLHSLIDRNEDEIDRLSSNQLITNEKLAAINGSVYRIESRLAQLVNILADDGEIPKTKTLDTGD